MSAIPEKYKDCYSYESRAAHGADDRKIEQIDSIVIGDKRHLIYQDSAGAFWYKSQIRKGARFIDMEEAIFGKNPPKKYYKHNA